MKNPSKMPYSTYVKSNLRHCGTYFSSFCPFSLKKRKQLDLRGYGLKFIGKCSNVPERLACDTVR